MSAPYLGEIRMLGGNFAPPDWALCDGSLLSTSEYAALFNLIGTTYGGDGQTTFALPDLRGRVPIHQGTGQGLTPRNIGQAGGAETVTLTLSQIPAHAHAPGACIANGNADSPADGYWAASSTTPQFVPGAQANISMNASALATTGGNLPHDNMPPFTTISFIIALAGDLPSANEPGVL